MGSDDVITRLRDDRHSAISARFIAGSARTSRHRAWSTDVRAAIVPSAPRDVQVNVATCRTAPGLRTHIDGVQRTFSKAGILDWTLWVPAHVNDAPNADDAGTLADFLRELGYTPRARRITMTADLTAWHMPELHDTQRRATGTPQDLGTLHDALSGKIPEAPHPVFHKVPSRLAVSYYAGSDPADPTHLVTALAAIDHPTYGGNGLAIVHDYALAAGHRSGVLRRIMQAAMAAAKRRGCVSATVHAPAGETRRYEDLGFTAAFALHGYAPPTEPHPAARRVRRRRTPIDVSAAALNAEPLPRRPS